ncbi:hypothetical protein ACFQWF_11840 [Methylorubrum suomiense]
MASLRAHFYDIAVRLAVKARLSGQSDIAAIRRAFDRDTFRPPPGVAFTPGELGGVPGEWAEGRTGRSGAPPCSTSTAAVSSPVRPGCIAP